MIFIGAAIACGHWRAISLEFSHGVSGKAFFLRRGAIN
jgi:hypothetical protein